MPTKTKPKYGWEPSGTFTPYLYSGISSFYKSTTKGERARYFNSNLGDREATIDDLTGEGINAYNKFYNNKLQQIANILGLHEVSDDFKKLFEGVTQNYLINKKHIPGIPRLSEVRASLMEVWSRAESLMQVLEKIDAITLDKLAMTSFPENLNDYNFLSNLPWNKKTDIHKVFSAAQKALSELEMDKGGCPEKTPLKKLIFELNEMYEKVTGKKATFPSRRKLYDLVHACLALIDSDAIHSDDSLRQYIKVLVPAKKSNLP